MFPVLAGGGEEGGKGGERKTSQIERMTSKVLGKTFEVQGKQKQQLFYTRFGCANGVRRGRWNNLRVVTPMISAKSLFHVIKSKNFNPSQKKKKIDGAAFLFLI